jgi:hypothetical protein
MRERMLWAGRFFLQAGAVAAGLALAMPAGAAEDADPPPEAAPEAEPVAPPEAPPVDGRKAPYSIPWQLRPLTSLTGVRLDTSLASYEDTKAASGHTVASFLTAQYRIPGTGPATAGLAVLARAALAADHDPAGSGATIISNPVLGAGYALASWSGFRANFSLSGTAPVGGGGGNSAGAKAVDARAKGSAARLGMDNSVFASNDVAVIGGVDAGYVFGGATIQLEATLFQLFRVRGEKKQHEATKTNLTSGVHAGYFFNHWFSLGGDLRYQRWLNAPFAAEAYTPALDQFSFSAGPRFHFRIGWLTWFRPGIAYARGLDRPLAAATPNYHIVQLDLPFSFY